MIVVRLEVENFGPFRGPHTLDLDGVHSLAITGVNSAGKSAIVDAIGFAIFGRVRQGTGGAGAWLTEGESKMRVALTLRPTTGPDFVFERRWAGGKGSVKVTGWEGSQARHARRAAEDLVGLTWDDYLSTVCLAQADMQRLAEADRSERRAIVERWLARPVWAAAREVLAKRWKVADQAWQRANDALADASARYNRAHEQVERWAEREPDAAVEERAAGAAGALEAVRSAEPVESPELHVLRARAHQADDEVDATRRLLRGEFDGECPILAAPCPVADLVKADVDGPAKRYAAAVVALDEAGHARNAEQAQHDEARRRWRAALQAAEAGDRQARDYLARHRAAGEAGERLQAEFLAAKADLDIAIEWSRAFESHRGVVAAAGRAAAPDGIAALEVEEGVGEAEQAAGSVLRAIGVPLGVRFQHDRELQRWADECAACGLRERAGRTRDACRCGAPWARARATDLDLVVETPAGDRDFGRVGGGQRDLVSLALRLAFGRRVGALRFQVGDEVLRQLHPDVRGPVSQYLLGGGGRAHGVDQVVVVTHDASAVAPAQRVLEVVPGERGSSLRWVR